MTNLIYNRLWNAGATLMTDILLNTSTGNVFSQVCVSECSRAGIPHDHYPCCHLLDTAHKETPEGPSLDQLERGWLAFH